MEAILNLFRHASTSWKTTLLGLATGVWVNLPQIKAFFTMSQQPSFNWDTAGLGMLLALVGAVARDADKSSEDHNVDGVAKVLNEIAGTTETK